MTLWHGLSILLTGLTIGFAIAVTLLRFDRSIPPDTVMTAAGAGLCFGLAAIASAVIFLAFRQA